MELNQKIKVSKNILYLSGPLFLILLLGWTPGISFHEDLGRHILLGKIITEQWKVPDTNLLSYTYPDFPFVNHHWLSEVFFYIIHSIFGLNGLIIWKMLIMCLTLSFAIFHIKSEKNIAIIWFAGICAAIILGYRSHIRPELFTYFFISLYLFLFEKIKQNKIWPRWLILLLSCLWSNLHIYFIFGIGMSGAFSIEQCIKNKNFKTILYETKWLLLIIFFSLVNPNGINALLYPFNIFKNYAVNVTENFSIIEYYKLYLNPMMISFPILCLIIISVLLIILFNKNIISDKLNWIAHFIIILTSFIAALKMARNVPLFALSSCFFLTTITNKIISNKNINKILIFFLLPLNILLCYGVINGCYFRIFPSPIGPQPMGFDNEQRYNRLKELKLKYNLSGPIFNDYNIGSLVEYQLYPEKAYADNRPEAYPDYFWKDEYEPARTLGKKFNDIKDKRGFNTIILSMIGGNESLIRELNNRPLWILVHLDEICAVFVRNISQNKLIIDACGFNKKRINDYLNKISESIMSLSITPFYYRQVLLDTLVLRLYGLICIGKEQLAWQYIRELHLIYPDLDGAYELMRITAPIEQVSFIEPLFKRRAKWPLSVKHIFDYGNHLIAKNKIKEALDIYKRGQCFFPLSDQLSIAIEKINSRTEGQ